MLRVLHQNEVFFSFSQGFFNTHHNSPSKGAWTAANPIETPPSMHISGRIIYQLNIKFKAIASPFSDV